METGTDDRGIEALFSAYGALRDLLLTLAAAIPPRFLADLDSEPPFRPIAARRLPCGRFLPRAAALAPAEAQPLFAALAAAAPALAWGQTYTADDLGPDFLDRYGWVELLGARGHFVGEALAAGLLMLGPDTLYPEHRHEAEEIYVPLTGGAWWRRDGEEFVRRDALAVVHHRSNMVHAMRTEDAPLLAIYLWRGGPLAQRSVLTAAVS